ncbi:MAG: DUF5009 domain-containing protein [bacterium]
MNDQNFKSKTTQENHRIISIDVLRGLTILIMLFVNDLAGVADVPGWLKHYQGANPDGMTFVDVVFPAFLFIVGMAIPFAIRKRLQNNQSYAQIWQHVLLRSFSLLVIGLFMVNSSYNNSDQGFLNPQVWTLLMYISIIFIWNTQSNRTSSVKKVMKVLKAVGIVLLAVLAVIHRGKGDPAFIEFQPMWWGILGLIGWAYLVSCSSYISLRNNVLGLAGIMAILYSLYMADSVAGPFLAFLRPWMNIGLFLCTHSAIIIAGILLGIQLTPESKYKTHIERIRWSFLYGLVLIIIGLLLHSLHDLDQVFTISKNLATVPWGLICSGIMAWVWLVVYWIIDIRGWRRWASFLSPAGKNPLFAYILAPIVLVIISLVTQVFNIPNFYDRLGNNFIPGLIRSVVIAFAMVWLTGLLRRVGIRMKL